MSETGTSAYFNPITGSILYVPSSLIIQLLLELQQNSDMSSCETNTYGNGETNIVNGKGSEKSLT